MRFSALSSCPLDVLPSWDIDVVTDQEVPLSLGVQSFYWGVIPGASLIKSLARTLTQSS